MFNKAFLEALADHFRREGAKVIERVAKNQPAAYLKICALLVPKEFKVQYSAGG
jgi:predicted transcriptional regulator